MTWFARISSLMFEFVLTAMAVSISVEAAHDMAAGRMSEMRHDMWAGAFLFVAARHWAYWWRRELTK
jgi:hypothetical protein